MCQKLSEVVYLATMYLVVLDSLWFIYLCYLSLIATTGNQLMKTNFIKFFFSHYSLDIFFL